MAARRTDTRALWWRKIDTALAIVVVALILLYTYEVMVGGRGLDLGYVIGHLVPFSLAAGVNLYVTSVSFVIGMAIGFFLGWLRTARVVPLKKVRADFHLLSDQKTKARSVRFLFLLLTLAWFALKHGARRIGDGYVEIVRGTPVFVQILFVWSVLVVNFPTLFATPAAVGLNAALIALTLNTGGYQSEIFRGGLQTVQAGQIEAARAMGLSRVGALRYVILPQALRLIIPPLTNEWIGLFKTSTLMFVIGVRGEITFFANEEAFKGNAFEVFAIVTGIFLLITVVLAKVVQILEQRYRIPGLGIQYVPGERATPLGRPRLLPRPP
jgi:glutamine transport system permease protein